MEAREAAVAGLQREHGAVLIPPYNYGPVMCGQGTMALELLRQASLKMPQQSCSLSIALDITPDNRACVGVFYWIRVRD